MKILELSYTKLRMNLASIMDKVNVTQAPILVNRRNGSSVYLVSVELYERHLKSNIDKQTPQAHVPEVITKALEIHVPQAKKKTPPSLISSSQHDLFQ